MKKIISYIKSILSGNSDASSKRTVGVAGAITLIAIVFIDTFTGKAPDEYVLNALISLEMIAFGGVAVENVGNAISKFRQFSKDKNRDIVDPIQDVDPINTGGISKAKL
jgi:hypothetical protein